MIRIVKTNGQYYGRDVNIHDEDEIENIEIFVNEGVPVILVENLDDLKVLYDIDKKDIKMI